MDQAGQMAEAGMFVAGGYALDMKDLNGMPRVMAHDLEFQPDDAAQFVVATDT
eukprot:gene54825-41324_t